MELYSAELPPLSMEQLASLRAVGLDRHVSKAAELLLERILQVRVGNKN